MNPPAAPLPLLLLDADGVLTDGRLWYDAAGGTAQAFSVLDGAALVRWRAAGGRWALLSGRTSAAVARRAAELGAAVVRQGAADKGAAFAEMCQELGVSAADVCYLADDLPDLDVLCACGRPVAVANARGEIKRAAVYVTRRGGGSGAVAETIDRLLAGLIPARDDGGAGAT